MADEKTKRLQGKRLAEARARAGWRSARAAALENSWAESTYRAHENGTRTIGQDDAEIYARRFRAAGVDVTAQAILFGSADDGVERPPAEAVGVYTAEPNATIEGPTQKPFVGALPRVPELGIGVASIDEDESAFHFNGQAIDHVTRPAGLANRSDVFAIRVANLSMWPRFRDGERIYVDSKRPAIEDFVVIELKPTIEGVPGNAYVKMLVARDNRKVTVEQFNPPGRIEFAQNEILRTFRVIPTEELWG